MQDSTVEIGSFTTREGAVIPRVQQRVTIYGDPAARVVLVPHALTGSSRAHEWWGALVGPDRVFDPREFCIVGINALGGCYGSTGPAGKPGFPYVSVADIVAAQARALHELAIDRIWLAIGASLGGMQALQWALDYPQRVERAVVVGSHDHQSAMGIALNAIQRDVIALDPRVGVRIARKIAMLSYKSDDLLRQRHDRRPDRKAVYRYDVEGYLEYQAELFEARMDPYSYVALTHAMDSFDMRDRIANGPSQRLLFVGISGDWLFRPQDVRAAAQRFAANGAACQYAEIDSTHGHDAFLAEPEKLDEILRAWLI